jgi:site-specific recombinase XerD
MAFTREGMNRIIQTSSSPLIEQVLMDAKIPDDSTASNKAGIERIKLYNAIRHSLGCRLLDEGVEFDKVQKILGHARSEMTSRYAKRSNESITQMLIDRRAKIMDFRGHLEVKNKTTTD